MVAGTDPVRGRGVGSAGAGAHAAVRGVDPDPAAVAGGRSSRWAASATSSSVQRETVTCRSSRWSMVSSGVAVGGEEPEPADVDAVAAGLRVHVGHGPVVDGRGPAAEAGARPAVGVALVRTRARATRPRRPRRPRSSRTPDPRDVVEGGRDGDRVGDAERAVRCRGDVGGHGDAERRRVTQAEPVPAGCRAAGRRSRCRSVPATARATDRARRASRARTGPGAPRGPGADAISNCSHATTCPAGAHGRSAIGRKREREVRSLAGQEQRQLGHGRRIAVGGAGGEVERLELARRRPRCRRPRRPTSGAATTRSTKACSLVTSRTAARRRRRPGRWTGWTTLAISSERRVRACGRPRRDRSCRTAPSFGSSPKSPP